MLMGSFRAPRQGACAIKGGAVPPTGPWVLDTGPSVPLSGRMYNTWWTFRIFFIFSARGRGRGSPRCREGGRGFCMENPRRGGVSPEWVGAGGGRGAGRVFAVALFAKVWPEKITSRDGCFLAISGRGQK